MSFKFSQDFLQLFSQLFFLYFYSRCSRQLCDVLKVHREILLRKSIVYLSRNSSRDFSGKRKKFHQKLLRLFFQLSFQLLHRDFLTNSSTTSFRNSRIIPRNLISTPPKNPQSISLEISHEVPPEISLEIPPVFHAETTHAVLLQTFLSMDSLKAENHKAEF